MQNFKEIGSAVCSGEYPGMKNGGASYNMSQPVISGEEGEGYDSAVEDQRQKLLDNSERLERSGKKLDVGYRVCVETEEIGNKVLG